jgi:hypothetical protein
MVKMKWVVLAVLAVVTSIANSACFLQTEEKKVKKQFRHLSEWASKERGETPITMAQRAQKIGTLFLDPCEFKTHIEPFSEALTPDEISSYAMRGRSLFTVLDLVFYDMKIDLSEERVAKVTVTVKATGRLKDGENIKEIHELECLLKKNEGGWLFSRFEVVEVLKR